MRFAFSSDWLNCSPVPGTLMRRQNSSRISGILASALRRPSSVRAIPQYSHMSSPISRWKESGVRSPSTESSRLIRSSVSATASATAGCDSSTASVCGLRAR